MIQPTAALLLSGGASSRFGGGPKALANAGERSVIRRMVEVSRARSYAPIVVVVGPHRGPIAHELRDAPVEIVDSEEWFEGRTASVQAGLRALPADVDVMMWPVDHPFVATRTLERLEAVREHDDLAVWFIPTFEGRGGHPILWKPPVRPDLLELRPDAPMRALLPEFGPQVRRVPVDDPGVLASIDSPEEYRASYDAWILRGED
ncbi:MAG TPA: nucleotidyltransferase family protein [Thermoplasmata archaeon]|nr:nucleotidyltransferase family protein [Thermoplasmata archaeon]